VNAEIALIGSIHGLGYPSGEVTQDNWLTSIAPGS
jgi:hypothetical protein